MTTKIDTSCTNEILICVDRPEGSVPRRSDYDPGSEYPPLLRELAIDAGGAQRHAARVEHAEWALARLLSENPEQAESITLDIEDVAALRALASVELHGRLGLEGGSTARMPWARRLGKGRRHASDGQAWDVAIERAFAQVPTEAGGVLGRLGEPTISAVLDAAERFVEDEALPWLVAYCLHRALRRVEVARPNDAANWYNAAVRIVLLRTAVLEVYGLEGWDHHRGALALGEHARQLAAEYGQYACGKLPIESRDQLSTPIVHLTSGK